jgi:septal ring-binding cell division protein DamX
MNNLNKTLLLTAIIFFAGCETGVKNKTNTNDMVNKETASGIIKQNGHTTYKSSGEKSSEIKNIFSKSAIPGYYLQVGHFSDKKPDVEFINRMKRSGLSYDIVEKYQDGTPQYYALVGPYLSYNKAKGVENRGKAKSISYGTFIVNVVHP